MEDKNIQANSETPILLRIVDAFGNEQNCKCDSVRLFCKNDDKNKNGGSIGIKRGHIKTIIALEEEKVIAFLKNEKIFESEILSGVAKVSDNIVLILKN